jgi:pimeloyl-ACP methyl ester carboxylesterase
MLNKSHSPIFSAAYAASETTGGATMGAHVATIGTIEVGSGMVLRRMVARGASPKGTVLLLHGFPETMLVWRDIANELARDFEVHAFDWPGFGRSSRPSADTFSYSPSGFADVLAAYVRLTGIDRSTMSIYATDIGSLPALLAAIRDPGIARRITVGDFAPFDRPQYMSENLQNLKSEPSASKARDYLNGASASVIANAHRPGLPPEDQFDLPAELLQDMTEGWSNGALTSADAFYHYYSHFSRDQDYLEAHLDELRTPVKVVWGEKDQYIDKAMGDELARRIKVDFEVLPGLGHYPHLQDPQGTIDDIRAMML